MSRRRISVGPVGRAVAHQMWSAGGVDAELHAILGSDARQMCNRAGRLFFVVLGAAIAENLSPEDPDIRIVRGAVNELYDIADLEEMPERSRAPVLSGLEAVKRISGRVKVKSLADSYFDLQAKLAAGDVHMSDFAQLMGERT